MVKENVGKEGNTMNLIKVLLTLMLFVMTSSADALSVYIPQPKADEVQISKSEYVRIHLIALGYEDDPKGLVRFLKGHDAKIFEKINFGKHSINSESLQIEFDLVSPVLFDAYLWQGDIRFKGTFSSSGYFWIREDTYRAQCLLNELGYSVGKPDGKTNEIYNKAFTEFKKKYGIESGEFSKGFEKLKYEADIAAEKFPIVFIRTIPRKSGPWVYPEINPIVKKEYLASLYLTTLGYPVEIQVIKEDQGRSQFGIVQLEIWLKKFQEDYAEVIQSDGALTDQVLEDLRKEFNKKYNLKMKS